MLTQEEHFVDKVTHLIIQYFTPPVLFDLFLR
jgi:hypothetical protein